MYELLIGKSHVFGGCGRIPCCNESENSTNDKRLVIIDPDII